ncbi:MAG: ComEA family DNA-binding protein [Anaerolineae bacterium]|nr:ComEA family DNA-binding protein [Anaerolineae bacterium]
MPMDGVFSPLIDVDEVREQVSAHVQRQYRIYAAVLVVMGLIIGGVIGATVTREKAQPGGMLTPPPYWEQVCSPAAVKDELVALPTATPQPLRVYISGAVAQPGVVTLPAGSLLVDALNAVGGAADDADLDGVNLAAALTDNQHVIVPRRAATPQPSVEVAATSIVVHAAALVNINTATAAELELLPHIGPAMAQRIIAYREAHGSFERIEDIQNVEGIGATRYKDLAPLITVE